MCLCVLVGVCVRLWVCVRIKQGNVLIDSGFFSFFQEYIARFGHGSAKLAAQAKSKEKTLARMVLSALLFFSLHFSLFF